MAIGFSAKTFLPALRHFSMWYGRKTGVVVSIMTSASVCTILSIASSPTNVVSGLTFQTSLLPNFFSAYAAILLPARSICLGKMSPAAINSMFWSAESMFSIAPRPRPPHPSIATLILSEPFAAPNENFGSSAEPKLATPAVFINDVLFIIYFSIFSSLLLN